MKRVCVIGAGNWGTAISIVIAGNRPSETLTLWCYEEKIDGRNLTEIINTDHTNPKYLPGVTLPKNIFATSDASHVQECDVAVFVLPHQFLRSVCSGLRLKKDAMAVSLTKGFIDEDCTLGSEFISKHFGISCAVLMGANIASEVSMKVLAESTLGCKDHGDELKKLFDCESFRVRVCRDVKGVELCGALKNPVAVAYGIVCGLGCGENTKAAILRIGINEIAEFLRINGVSSEVMFESCGVPDLVVTCLAGRNRACGEQLAKGMKVDELLQGPGTARCVYKHLKGKGLERDFVLLSSVYKVCFEEAEPRTVLECLQRCKSP